MCVCVCLCVCVCVCYLMCSYLVSQASCKAAKRDTLSESQDRQRQFLSQLFPMVTVEEEEFSKWLDQFEVKVQTILTGKDQEVSLCVCRGV